MTSICIHGRQPAIGRAELEALYGAKSLTRINDIATIVDGEVDFGRLGGTVKMAEHLTTVDSPNPQKVFDFCRRRIVELAEDLPAGKIKLGVSLYGLDMPVHKINANTLSLKKALKSAGRSVRVIPNTELALSSAQTYHNSLASELGCELVFVAHDNVTHIGRVTHVQAIDSYTRRDRERPKRDAFVGMLPPKLAQTIINLATASSPSGSAMVLDPFCGTGVILQEALLMGYSAYGTDISPKMIDFSSENINWLHRIYPNIKAKAEIKLGDAISHKWDISSPMTVACEGYLGQPIGGQTPTEEKLLSIIHDCNSVMRSFLKNIHSQIPDGTRLCIAAPAWLVLDELHHLPVINELTELGFKRISFATASDEELIYRREDQQTARELLVLIKS